MKTVNTHHLIKLHQLHEYLVKSEETPGFDRLRFKDENEVFSTTMASTYGYTIGKLVDRQESGMSSDDATRLNPNNTMILIIHNKKHEIQNLANLSDDDVVNIIGTISQNGKYIMNPLYSSEIDSDKRPDWLKWTQTGLDYTGFIPVVGDALDIINASIYFYYGKTFDGILSLIGAIPVIGSAVALPIRALAKAGGKTIKRIIAFFSKANKTGDWASAFEELAKSGLLIVYQKLS
jgi:hypothetical protein